MLYSFRSKVSALLIGWTLCASILLSYSLLSLVRGVSYDEFERKAIQITNIFSKNISKSVYMSDIFRLNNKLEVLQNNPDYSYIYVYDKSGKLISSSKAFDKNKFSENLLIDINTEKVKKPINQRGQYDNKVDVYDCITPIDLKGTHIGFLRIGYSMEHLTASDLKALYLILGVSLGVILAGVLCSILIVGKMMKPINSIIKITKEVSKGNLDYWIPVKASSEMGDLVESFKKMIKVVRYEHKENKKNQAQLQLSLGNKTEEAKKLERKLVQSDRFAIIKEFTGGIAHELKNPFTSIQGYAQIAKEKLSGKKSIDDEKDVQSLYTYFDFVEKDVVSCRCMIDDLLNFSRPTELQVEPFDANFEINEELEMIKPQYESKNLKIIKNLGEDIPKIKANKEKIKQVIRNILINARKFMDDGGELVVYSALRTDNDKEYLEMRFRDDGIGISEENLGKVFLPFFTTKHGGEGTGLGMAISYGIIKNHKGSIEVDSVLGQGTTFTIRLPFDLENNAENDEGE